MYNTYFDFGEKNQAHYTQYFMLITKKILEIGYLYKNINCYYIV